MFKTGRGETSDVMAKDKTLACLALFLVAWFFGGCERSTRIRIEGGKAPVFVLSGSGELAIFVVYGPDYMTKAESPSDENYALWKIKPSGGYFAGTPVEELKRITYGVVPDGYTQVKPQVGSAPPLVEGQKYLYWAETANAPGSGGALKYEMDEPCLPRHKGPVSEARKKNGFVSPAACRRRRMHSYLGRD